MQTEIEQNPQGKPKSKDNTAANEEKEVFDFKSLRFGWFVGHVVVVLNTLIFAISTLCFHPLGFFYRFAYLGVVASYTVTLWHLYMPLTNMEYDFKRILLDQNAQYLIIAIYFLFSRRVAVTLIPFFIYSVIHALQFVNARLIPKFAPHQTKLQSTISNFNSKYFDTAMTLVAKIEVCGVMTRLVLGLFVFRSSILSILVYAQFLRMRYYMSEYMRNFLNDLGIKVDKALTPATAHPKIPPAVINAYGTAKNKLAAVYKPVSDVATPKKQL